MDNRPIRVPVAAPLTRGGNCRMKHDPHTRYRVLAIDEPQITIAPIEKGGRVNKDEAQIVATFDVVGARWVTEKVAREEYGWQGWQDTPVSDSNRAAVATGALLLAGLVKLGQWWLERRDDYIDGVVVQEELEQ